MLTSRAETRLNLRNIAIYNRLTFLMTAIFIFVAMDSAVYAAATSSYSTQHDFSLPPANKQGEEYILYIPIPTDVSKDVVSFAEETLKNRLHNLIKESLADRTLRKGPLEEEEAIDRIVIFTDHAGQPILPDLEAAKSQHGMSGLPALTVTAANELTFTFDSSTYPWSAEEQEALTTILNDCYPLAKTIYGDPAFNIMVNVRKDPTISFAGLYYPSLNEMVLRNASSSDPICHEMIHAFRDDNIITLSSYEEGMTRAAEVEVFNQLPTYVHWDENHSYTYDVYYEGLNKQKIGSRNGNFFAGYIGVLLRYQLGGYAWAKALLENSNFLADFNRELYTRTLSDPTTPSTESTLLDIATTVQSKVENKTFSTWYNQQGVLNTDPPEGYFLYQRINQFTVDYFYRDPSGTETMQPNVTVEWAVYDHSNVLLDNGSGVTSANGWFNFIPALPAGYTGRITVVVTTTSPNGLISDTTLRPAFGFEAGIFGIVRNADTGTITLTPLDDPAAAVTLDVVNGAFSAPSLASVRGRFRAVFTNSAGKKFSKRFNKDASDYFVSIRGG